MLRRVTGVFRAHLRAFIYELDPIEDEKKEESPSKLGKYINVHFCFAFLMTTGFIIESYLALLGSNFNYQNPSLFYHKIYPKIFWKISDVIFFCAMILMFFIYGRLSFNWKMGEKYRMRVDPETGNIVANQAKWSPTLSRRILAFRRKTRPFLAWSLLIEIWCAFSYWQVALYLNWTHTVRDILISFAVPFLALYSTWAALNISFYFLLIVNYTRFQQLFPLKKIEKLVTQMRTSQGKTLGKKFWRRFVRNNQQVLIFFDHLRGYSVFWSPFISVYFILLACIFVYMLYGSLLNSGNLNVVEKYFFSFFAFEMFLLLSFITNECSKVVRNNVKIYKANVSFCYQFQKRGNPSAVNLIQMSKLISNYKGTRNGFQLINNQIIDSKMFQILIFYICRLFFKRFN